jgi:hypothetical protein
VKTCAQCNEAKPLALFYQHPKASDGLMHICKACHRLRVKLRARTNPYVQDYDRARHKTPEHKRRAMANAERWNKENPAGYRAHNILNGAINRGKIIKEPCVLCGTTEHVHGHHKDYAQPLDVVWLCAKCHHRLHANFPELGTNSGAS